MKKELTLTALKNMKPDTIFARGEVVDGPEGINMENSGIRLRWLAVRGGIHDWAIYCAFGEATEQDTRDSGDKVHDSETIKRLVPCTDEAFEMYRH